MQCILAISKQLTWLPAVVPAAAQASDLKLTVPASQMVLHRCQAEAGGSACEQHLGVPPLTVSPIYMTPEHEAAKVLGRIWLSKHTLTTSPTCTWCHCVWTSSRPRRTTAGALLI